jgi:hypothetical protein
MLRVIKKSSLRGNVENKLYFNFSKKYKKTSLLIELNESVDWFSWTKYPSRNCVMSSRRLSNYMFYLPVDLPTMLAIELSKTRYTDTTIHLFLLLFWHTQKERKHNTISDNLDALLGKRSVQEAKVDAFFNELLRSPFTMLKEIENIIFNED